MSQRNPDGKLARLFGRRRGISAVWVVCVIPALAGFAALLVDGGYLYVVREQVQSISDSAARAGVKGLGSVALPPTWYTNAKMVIQNTGNFTRTASSAISVSQVTSHPEPANTTSYVAQGYWDGTNFYYSPDSGTTWYLDGTNTSSTPVGATLNAVKVNVAVGSTHQFFTGLLGAGANRTVHFYSIAKPKITTNSATFTVPARSDPFMAGVPDNTPFILFKKYNTANNSTQVANWDGFYVHVISGIANGGGAIASSNPANSGSTSQVNGDYGRGDILYPFSLWNSIGTPPNNGSSDNQDDIMKGTLKVPFAFRDWAGGQVGGLPAASYGQDENYQFTIDPTTSYVVPPTTFTGDTTGWSISTTSGVTTFTGPPDAMGGSWVYTLVATTSNVVNLKNPYTNNTITNDVLGTYTNATYPNVNGTTTRYQLHDFGPSATPYVTQAIILTPPGGSSTTYGRDLSYTIDNSGSGDTTYSRAGVNGMGFLPASLLLPPSLGGTGASTGGPSTTSFNFGQSGAADSSAHSYSQGILDTIVTAPGDSNGVNSYYLSRVDQVGPPALVGSVSSIGVGAAIMPGQTLTITYNSGLASQANPVGGGGWDWSFANGDANIGPWGDTNGNNTDMDGNGGVQFGNSGAHYGANSILPQASGSPNLSLEGVFLAGNAFDPPNPNIYPLVYTDGSGNNYNMANAGPWWGGVLVGTPGTYNMHTPSWGTGPQVYMGAWDGSSSPAIIGNPSSGLNYVDSITPGLQQTFYVGNGVGRTTGSHFTITVPSGATRLYLGTHMSINTIYKDNTGGFNVTIGGGGSTVTGSQRVH